MEEDQWGLLVMVAADIQLVTGTHQEVGILQRDKIEQGTVEQNIERVVEQHRAGQGMTEQDMAEPDKQLKGRHCRGRLEVRSCLWWWWSG